MVTQTQHSQQANAYWALVPAAGIGKRMNSHIPKQYLKLQGKEVLAWSLEALQKLESLQGIVLVLHPQDDYFQTHLAEQFPDIICVSGGEERVHSVAAGLAELEKRADIQDWVLVHDAVRPCITQTDLQRLIQTLAGDAVGGILAAPVKDTLKHTGSSGVINATPNREEYWLAMTPQMFRFHQLDQALKQAIDDSCLVTDEAAALERSGLPVKVVAGRSDNIKITSAEDLALAEFILGRLAEQEDQPATRV